LHEAVIIDVHSVGLILLRFLDTLSFRIKIWHNVSVRRESVFKLFILNISFSLSNVGLAEDKCKKTIQKLLKPEGVVKIVILFF